MVSRDNFLLFTPMLPEVSTGRIETRHIVTPVRSFIDDNNSSSSKNIRFHQANIDSIDLHNKQVTISHDIGFGMQPANLMETEYNNRLNDGHKQEQQQQQYKHKHLLNYDYLVIALGSETNFFGIDDMRKYALTMKDIDDAITVRNHILNMLEQADLEYSNPELRRSFLTFVVVGGGFNGIETVGELNDFVRETVRKYYKNIYMTDIRIIVVNAGDKILDQVDGDLGR